MAFRLISPGNPLLSLKLEDTPSIAAILDVVRKANISTEHAQVLGRDGRKKVPLATDEDATRFFEAADLPTIEILYNCLDTETYELELVRREKDRNEHLEDENHRLSKTVLDVNELVREMEENRRKEREEVRELIQAQATSLQAVVQTASANLNERWEDMQATSEAIQKEVRDALQTLATSSAEFDQAKKSLDVRLVELDQRLSGIDKSRKDESAPMRSQIDSIQSDIQCLRQTNTEQAKQLQLLEATKVNKTHFEETVEDLNTFIKKLDQEQRTCAEKMEARLKGCITDEEDIRIKEVKRLDAALCAEATRLDKELRTLCDEATKGRNDIRALALQAVHDLKEVTQTKFQGLQGAIKHQEEVAQTQFEKTSQSVLTIHTDVAKAHERLVQEARNGDARIVEGVDVLVEQLETLKSTVEGVDESVNRLSARQDSESTGLKGRIATLEANAEESMRNVQEIVGGLDEKFDYFKQSCSKHMALLQQDNTAYHKTIAELEKAKTRLVEDWDIFSREYRVVHDKREQEGIRVNNVIEKICRQLEPSTLEWRLDHVAELKRKYPSPMNYRSATAQVCGVQLTFDWFPNGNDQKIYKDGVCILRLYAPKGTKIKFEVTLGTFSDGARDWDTDVMDLWTDVVFQDWEGSIARDSITFKVDIHENKSQSGGDGPCGLKAVRIRNDDALE